MKLKSKIANAKKANEILKEEKERNLNIFNNMINEIKSFHRKINNCLLKQKNQHLSIKQSMNNENDIDIYENVLSNYIQNKQNLNEITTLKANIKNKEEKEKIKKKLKKLKEDIILINEKIHKKTIEFDNLGNIKYLSTRYIINPIPIALEKNSEYSIQLELSKKLRDNALEINEKNKIIKKKVEETEKELQKLKKKNPEIEEKEHNKSSININPKISLKTNDENEEFLGIIDDNIKNYNIDSPIFLTKVTQNSKLDFQFNEKLDFSNIYMNHSTSSKIIKNKKKLNKSNNNINNNNNKTFINNLNKNSNIENNNNVKKEDDKKILDWEIQNTEKQISDLKEELTKLLEENETLKNQKGNLQVEILKQNSKINSCKNQIQYINNDNINIKQNKINPNTVSEKEDKDTSSKSINDSGIFNISL